MMSEEISINNPSLPLIFKNLYEQFLTNRNYEIIYTMYKHLQLSKKCRLLSDIKNIQKILKKY